MSLVMFQQLMIVLQENIDMMIEFHIWKMKITTLIINNCSQTIPTLFLQIQLIIKA